MTGNVAKIGLQGYMSQLQRHPLRTKAITSGVLSAISDIVAQKLSGIQKLQTRRILLKLLLGCAYVAPFRHYFHMLLDKIFKGKTDTKTVAKKVAIEQLAVFPLNTILIMIYYGCIVDGRPWTQVKRKIRTDFLSLQLTAWTSGLAFGWINHKYVPLELRVVYQSLLAFCWGVFMTLRTIMVPIKP
ncbi:hypothetical protein RND81_06G136600 [Saponaria officinalis]|uniref:Peroxisomal membrane protein PMP22 n=1 Tax=Saponaria officinalis TaxID=3572 RepID=A0AAW1K9Q7_SAPOF